MAEGPGSRFSHKLRSTPNTVHYAAEAGDFQKLNELLKKGLAEGHSESVTLQQREEVLGLMPIHLACEFGKLDVVEFLIKKLVDLEVGDRFRVTPMHLAAVNNFPDIIQALLAARCPVSPIDEEGDMPIHWAATKGNTEAVTLLIKRGSPIDTHNKLGWTPLHRAAYNGRRLTVEALVNAGANMQAVNKDGNTALHLACFGNHLATIELLCQLGSKHDLLNVRLQTPGDLCIVDAARDILKQFNWGVLVSGKDVDKAEPEKKVEQVINNLDKLGIKTEFHNSRKKIGLDGFPSMMSPDPVEQSDGRQHSGNDASLAFGDRGSGFLKEASQAFESLASNASPYMVEHQRMNNSVARQQRPLSGASSRAGQDATQEQAAHSNRANGAASMDAPSRLLHPINGGMSFKLGTPLPPINSFQQQAEHGDGSDAGDANGSSSDDYQTRVREENRRAAAANGSSTLPQRAGVLGGTERTAARPVSSQKRFLSKYNLGHMNLFAPA